MATKLPSGRWRAQVFVGMENGKRIYKSFVEDTKERAELEALKFSASLPRDGSVKTLRSALEDYIESRRPVLSQTTIRGYVSNAKKIAETVPDLYAMRLSDINKKALQQAVNSLSQGLSPKSVRNIIRLVGSVLRENGYQVPAVALPARVRPDTHIPDRKEVQILMEAVRGSRWEVAVLLAALGPMRRGEIVAARLEDLEGNVLHVHRAAIEDEHCKQVIKETPKTDASNRYILLPDYVADLIRQQGYVTNMSIKQISKGFNVLLKQIGLPPFRFHDLRHAFVSIAHAAGIPDAYIMERGGWSTSYTMTQVYRHTLSQERQKMDRKVNDLFLQHDLQHVLPKKR